MRQVPGSRLLARPRELAEFRVCRAKVPLEGGGARWCHHIEATPKGDPTTVPEGMVNTCPGPVQPTHEAKWEPLRVHQCPLSWVAEADIASAAITTRPDGTRGLNPGVVLERIIEHTVADSNFGLTSEYLGDLATDDARDLGWRLFDWLGGPDLIQRLAPTRAAAQQQGQEARKKS